MPNFTNIHNEEVTTTTGKKIWNSRSVAVSATILAQCRGVVYVAIGKRGKGCPDKVGFWNLPCGYLDFNETAGDAAKRELWEEIGLDVDDVILKSIDSESYFTDPWNVNSKPTESRQNVSLRFGSWIHVEELPVLKPGNCSEPDEVEDAKWVHVAEIQNGKYSFAFGHDQVILEFRQFISY